MILEFLALSLSPQAATYALRRAQGAFITSLLDWALGEIYLSSGLGRTGNILANPTAESCYEVQRWIVTLLIKVLVLPWFSWVSSIPHQLGVIKCSCSDDLPLRLFLSLSNLSIKSCKPCSFAWISIASMPSSISNVKSPLLIPSTINWDWAYHCPVRTVRMSM